MEKLLTFRNPLKIAASLTLLVVLFIQNTVGVWGAANWPTPSVLSPAGSFAWFPDIISDVYGRVHVVWAAGAEGYDQVYYTNSDDGQKWQPPVDVFAVPWVGLNSAATRPTMLIDSNGHLNVSFVDLTTVFYSSAPLESTLIVNRWRPKQAMSKGQTAYFSRMAMDRQNNLHYVFTQNAPSEECPNCYHLFYRKSTDDGTTWSAPVDLVKEAIGAVKPQILVDAEDHIHVVWESGKGGGLGQLTNPTSVSYAGSVDGGKTWSQPENLSRFSADMGKNIAIGSDRLGNLVVAWWGLPMNRILYQVSSNSGKTWSTPAPIPGVWGAARVYQSNLDNYAFAIDGDGNLHLVAVGALSADQPTLNVLNLMWNGSQWAAPDVVASYKGDVPEWPRVSISQGNLMNVIWFVRDEPHIWLSDQGQYRVWYTRAQIDAKSIEPKPLPTAAAPEIKPSPTPKTLITAAPTAAQTATSRPAMAPSRGPQTETDYVLLLALAVVPSVLLIAGMAIYVMIRRR